MGNKQGTELYRNETPKPMATDYSCKNINMNYKDNSGKPIFACPDASSLNGTCSCGDSCLEDGETCCQAIEQIKVGGKIQKRCVEDILNPSDFVFKRYGNPNYELITPPKPYTTNSPVITSQPFISRPTPRKRTYVASSPNSIKYQPCNMADVKYNNDIIPGQQLCDWFNPKTPTTIKYNDSNIPITQLSAWYSRPTLYN